MGQLSNITALKTTSGLLCHVIVLACLYFTPTQLCAKQQAIIISSDNSLFHKSLVDSIEENLKDTSIKITNIRSGQQENFDTNNSIIISLGNKATDILNQRKLPNTQIKVITSIDPDGIVPKSNEHYLSMSHSICRQFSLIRHLNADWKTVSFLLSTPNIALTQKIESCAAQHQLKLKGIVISKYVTLIDALNSSLSESDVLLALPDPSVYNARTIKSILLTTYRHRTPVIGFSESFVRAGALAAVSSSSEQLGKQIAELIKKYSEDKLLNNHRI